MVWPDSVLPLRSVIVADRMIGHLALGIDLGDSKQRRLGAERVDDRFDQQDVDAAVDQPAHLLGEGIFHLIERHRAERGIVDVGRNRQRLVRRAHRSCDKPRLVGRRPLVGGLFRQLRRLDVQLIDERLERVIGLRDCGSAERVRLDDVCASREILLMDVENDIGARQHEHIVVAAQLFSMRFETLAAEVLFRQLVALDHRPHRAIENQNALRQKMFKSCSDAHRVSSPWL